MRKAAALLPLLLACCIGTEPERPIGSEAQAIALAKERCAWTRPNGADQWHAKLHEGQWHVWLVRDRDPREPAMGLLDVWIKAKNGDSGDCNKAG